MKKNIKIIMKNLKIAVYMLMALLFGINTTFGQKPGKKIPVFDVADALAEDCVDDVKGLVEDDNPVLIVLEF